MSNEMLHTHHPAVHEFLEALGLKGRPIKKLVMTISVDEIVTLDITEIASIAPDAKLTTRRFGLMVIENRRGKDRRIRASGLPFETKRKIDRRQK